VIASVSGAIFAGLSNVLIPLIIEETGRGPTSLATVFAAFGIATTAGSILYERLAHRMQVIPTLSLCLGTFAACTLLLSFAPSYEITLFGTAVVGFVLGILKPTVVTRTQKYSPSHIRNDTLGIVTALGMFIALPVVLAVGTGVTVFGMKMILLIKFTILALSAFLIPQMAIQMTARS
jgi:predicted MFS family arabinose efflux permease